MKREKTILLRLSEKESEIIKQKAAQQQLSVSEYIRIAAMDAIPRKEKQKNENNI